MLDCLSQSRRDACDVMDSIPCLSIMYLGQGWLKFLITLSSHRHCIVFSRIVVILTGLIRKTRRISSDLGNITDVVVLLKLFMFWGVLGEI